MEEHVRFNRGATVLLVNGHQSTPEKVREYQRNSDGSILYILESGKQVSAKDIAPIT